MPELSSTQTVSRSSYLELQDEQRLVNDGYEFLDEKRILLAAELLRQRDAYRQVRTSFMAHWERASAALLEAAADQGLGGLQVYPARESSAARLNVRRRPYVGQTLLDASFEAGDAQPGYRPLLPSPVVRNCRESFGILLAAAARLAALGANIARLVHEYRRTERRVRALENVVLPEIRQQLAAMEELLELVEQEEVIRVRTLRTGRNL
ncbi:MAG: V-type ATP synthase subunit D [Gammaproteobacteria bacterium]|nr:V-type ATP synthase subunit D [Gammaproteobacteria bacterium]